MIGKYMNGTLGWTPVPYMSAKQETMEMKRKAHKGNCFNLKRSDSLDLNRPVPDVRCKPCKDIQYDVSVLPNTSVVIVFFNEPLSTLYRSVHSVLNKAPPELLHEIVLVDDGSNEPWLKKGLDEYVSLLPKVKLVRLAKRWCMVK
eukprot:TRINITY_DN2403_c0_g1_i3.p1 TRINITY_DN2403_c0_g1~~TRINITY_DN2403_c0_g1_i3.p1  ORF type:complete len:145 (+),score=30.53 TRINITY_DN2403_c0_g1_i3:400-834(+)